MKNKDLLPWGKHRKGTMHFGSKSSKLKRFLGGISACIIFITCFSTCKATDLVSDEIPIDIKKYFEEVGEIYDLSPELLEAIAYSESRFVPDAKNKNYYGLMQINIKVHSLRIEKYGWTSKDMLDSQKNIIVAADYISDLCEAYDNDIPAVLLVYSGSGKKISAYKEYGFITSYVEDVLNKTEEYQKIHAK